jgi:transglutaminase-like putative cysteine protease
MLLHVVHETRYRYAPAVVNAHHVVHLKPASRSGQTLLSYDLRIDPAPVQLRETVDVYGNTRSYFSLQTAHESLTVVADSIVSTSVANPLQSEASLSTGRPASPPWEQVRDQFRYRAGAAYDSASEFLFASPYVPRDEAFAEFARPSFLPGRPLPEAMSAAIC